MKKEEKVSQSCATVLNGILEGVPKDLMNEILKDHKNMKGRKYTEELKAFALTLQFYSNKAYEYVRKKKKNCLYHTP